ncbi:MAG: sensor histidine kinase, partial [Balneolaceae bacterium]
ELQSSLAEKETLLAEIHHRVKNNLAVVSGMMQLQAFESDNKDLQAKLYDSVFRIKTMATVHELLYQSNSFSRLEFSETMKKLIENVSDTLKTDKEIEIDINCKKVTLNINQAIPASLIVNEVLTNAFKHAFTNKDSGEIKFLLSESGDKIHMEISDDGKGILENNIVKEASLGYHLIQVLSEQLGGEFEYKNQNPGTIFTLYFKKEDKKRGVGNAKM